MFPWLLLGPMMTDDEYGWFCMFIKMKPLVFWGTKSEYTFEFLIYYHDCLNKMGIFERYKVELVTFQLQTKAKK